MSRLKVQKTYKLYINGAFPRSESGRVLPVHNRKGEIMARAAQASRKDLRDAVKAAEAAQPGWAGRTGYNRGQIMYRMAEVLEDRAEVFIELLRSFGNRKGAAEVEVALTIDRLVWYAGWCDKYAQVAGNSNPVSGPFFNLSTPDPSGVVGLAAPSDSYLIGPISRLAPALVTGNAVVLLAASQQAMVAVTLAEVINDSDVPSGVINILTGSYEELLGWMAGHLAVNVVDCAGASDQLTAEVAAIGADGVTRVIAGPSQSESVDWSSPNEQSPLLIEKFTEIKTVWHPKGR